ncbi:MAG: type II CRISPR-associated endonuclease Cas1 [Pseudomonadota bacterium]
MKPVGSEIQAPQFGASEVEQIVDIAADNRHLSRERGFLLVSEEREEVGRVPLDQILAVLIHAHGVTYSNNLLVALADQGSPLVICGSNHAPRAILWPLEGHFAQGARMRAQWNAKQPLIKQAWKQVVIAKLVMQAAALDAFGAPSEPVRRLIREVRSGDESNVEAQAARRYWPLLMGEDFRRDQGAGGTNALLNYGYTILRSAAARAIVAAGLHPTIGLFHANRGNAFSLADDVMEPFRPLVDCCVKALIASGTEDVTPEAKRCLARLIAVDLPSLEGRSPLTTVLGRLTLSLARSYEGGKPELEFPAAPTAIELRSLGSPE